MLSSFKNNHPSSRISRAQLAAFECLWNRIPLYTGEHRILFTNVQFPKQILSLPSKNSVCTHESSRVTVVHIRMVKSPTCVLLRFLLPVVMRGMKRIILVVWQCFCKSTYTRADPAVRPGLVMYLNRRIVSHDTRNSVDRLRLRTKRLNNGNNS